MAVPAGSHFIASKSATYHVQVNTREIARIARDLREIRALLDLWPHAEATIIAKIMTVFRRGVLNTGDDIAFRMHVQRKSELPPPDWYGMNVEDLGGSRTMEVILNGEPPNCNVVLGLARMISAPSAHPHIDPSGSDEFWREQRERCWTCPNCQTLGVRLAARPADLVACRGCGAEFANADVQSP